MNKALFPFTSMQIGGGESLDNRLHNITRCFMSLKNQILDVNIPVNGPETAEWLLCCVPAVRYGQQAYLLENSTAIPGRGHLMDCHCDAAVH